MKDIHAYLTFDGNAREAMAFYAKCLGAELQIQSFADAKIPCPPEAANRVLHAKLTKGSAVLMASDTMPGMPFHKGSNVSISIQCESLAEIERLFPAFGERGTVTMPLEDTFWNARFGMLTDRYGIHWMFNFDKSGGK
jgi:PhnB protein